MLNLGFAEYDVRQLYKGVALLLAGALAPFFLDDRVFGIYDTLALAAALRDSGYLFWSGLRLVVMNCLRTTPCYLGAFMIAEALTLKKPSKLHILLPGRIAISAVVMIGLYAAINAIYNIQYDFAIPAAVTITVCSVLKEFDLYPARIAYKMIAVAFLIILMQWLTVVPALTPMGFGRGEIAMDVKYFAELMGLGDTLGRFGVLMSAIFLMSFVIIIKLANDERKIERGVLQAEIARKRIMAMRMENLSLRSFREIQHLVHDLKTPLTTIQGLSTLSELMESNGTIVTYQRKITESVDVMNEMISEILYENSKSVITVAEVFNLITTQTSINEKLFKMLQCDVRCPEARIEVNKVRFARAMINVIENAEYAVSLAHAADPENGRVQVRIERDGEWILFSVRDNGTGISEEGIRNIWTPGFSLNESSGLGLVFTKGVIENHGGSIAISSVLGEYTLAEIRIREVSHTVMKEGDPR